jgi:deazaflavin-dependent oxidoreductase (nitroreductase family)
MSKEFSQKDHGFLTYPDHGWRKALFQWPVHLWRLGLGPLIGHHMVLISHTGRKTGLPHHTMTELYVIEGRKYAPSGFGRRAQWYRNIQADPRVTIQTAAGAESKRAVRVVEDEEILSLLAAVKRRSQAFYHMYLDTLEIQPTEADILAKKERIHWLRFDPTLEVTPPPLPADLVWLWPAAVIGLAAIWLVRKLVGDQPSSAAPANSGSVK